VVVTIDPLAYPSESGLRFPLFVLTGILISWFYGDYLTGVLLDWGSISGPYRISCALATAAGVLVLSYLWYRTVPTRTAYRFKLSEPSDREMIDTIARLCGRASVPMPRVMVAPRPRSQNAQVFGRKGAYILRVDSGLGIVLRKAPELFAAVVLHELAHIKANDVARAYYARCLLQVLIALALALALDRLVRYLGLEKAVLSSIDVRNPDDLRRAASIGLNLLLSAIQLPAILIVLIVEYARIVRVRETFADWLSGTWGGLDALKAILGTAAVRYPQRAVRLLRLHPTPSERLGMLNNPLLYYKGSLLDAACFGALGAMLTSQLGSIQGLIDHEVAGTGNMNVDRYLAYPWMLSSLWLSTLLSIGFFMYIIALLGQRIAAGIAYRSGRNRLLPVRALLSYVIAAAGGAWLAAVLDPNNLVHLSVFPRAGEEDQWAELIGAGLHEAVEVASMYLAITFACILITYLIFRVSGRRKSRPVAAFRGGWAGDVGGESESRTEGAFANDGHGQCSRLDRALSVALTLRSDAKVRGASPRH
jgi:Zn-dependent protease with chaperone function